MKGDGIRSYINLMVSDYPGYLKDRDIYSIDSLIKKCRLFPKNLQTYCFEGMVKGHFKTGDVNDKEQLNAQKLCLDSRLNEEEKDACARMIIKNSYEFYPEKKANNICNEIKADLTLTCSRESILK